MLSNGADLRVGKHDKSCRRLINPRFADGGNGVDYGRDM